MNNGGNGSRQSSRSKTVLFRELPITLKNMDNMGCDLLEQKL